jgi:hypothetical protein
MDQGCQQIRSQGVDGKDMRETVFGLNAARFPVTNGNVMYHRIQWAKPDAIRCSMRFIRLSLRALA